MRELVREINTTAWVCKQLLLKTLNFCQHPSTNQCVTFPYYLHELQFIAIFTRGTIIRFSL